MFENIRIAETIERLLRAQPEISNVEVIEVLKGGPKNHVCIVDVDGEKVVVKRFLGDGAYETVIALQKELKFVRLHLDGIRNRMNECLFAYPDIGLVGLSFAPGRRLGAALLEADLPQRSQLMRHSGEWLEQYTAPRRRTGSFGPKHWLRQLSAFGDCEPQDQALLDDLRTSLVAQIGRTMGQDITHAATHGDYVSLNAHYHDGVIYGVDVQGESWLPLCKDIAGFLVWEGMRRAPISGDRQWGILKSDFDSFLSKIDISKNEESTILPFMIGVQFYRRVVGRRRGGQGMEHVYSSVRSYISDVTA